MNKKILILIIIVTLINLSALGTMIYQQWINPSPCAGVREFRFEQVKRELDLTATQIESFEEIRRAFHSKMDSLNQVLEGLNNQLLQEIWQPHPQDGRIDTLLNQISQLQMESQYLVIWHFYQFKKVLTPDQWDKFYSIVSERFPNMRRVAGSRRAASAKEDRE
ncbi:MAG: periplasmic heavy metal sensor [candidate division KSB1 bacterium]|nr:periplasmic heavy metal sensor [candidate division KSB1 bacterium]